MNDKIIGNENNILFYNDEEGNVKVEVLLENEDVWINTEALATLFNIDRSGIVRHINNIYKNDELSENSTCAKIARTSERMFYQKITDIFAECSIDYDKNSDTAITFYKTIAKNYLDEKEIKNLNNLVNLFLDIAENNAERNIPMYMNDWKNEVENALKVFHYEVLEGKGKISHKQAIDKAESEYEKYKVIQDKNYVSDFDKLLNETKEIENK